MSLLKYSEFRISPIFPDVMTSQALNLSQECLPHFHLDYDITLVTSGMLLLKVGRKTYFYRKHQLCIIDPCTVHRGQSVGDDLLSTQNIRVSPEFMLKVAKTKHSNHPNSLYFNATAINDTELRDLFKRYFCLSRNAESAPQAVSDAGWLFFSQLFNHSSNFYPRELSRPYDRLSGIDLMKNKIREKLNIRDLASRMNVSEYYFIKRFKKQYGITPYRFFMQMKLESAFKELAKGGGIKEVTYKFGYSDQAHFNRLLKKHYGYTPTEVKRLALRC